MAGGLLVTYKRTEKGAYQFDWLMLHLPVFGALFRKVGLSRFAKTTATMIKSGVPILGTLEIVADTSGNRVIAQAVERARVTGEPTLVEIVTYRFRGHSMSDPGLYRTKEEVEEWRRRDPLNRSRSRLLEIGMAEAAIDALEADVKAEIEDSVKFAEDSAPADAYAPYVMKGAQ